MSEAMMKLWVNARKDDHKTPSPRLDDFLDAYRDDDNWWWMLEAGDMQNLFDEAVDRLMERTA